MVDILNKADTKLLGLQVRNTCDYGMGRYDCVWLGVSNSKIQISHGTSVHIAETDNCMPSDNTNMHLNHLDRFRERGPLALAGTGKLFAEASLRTRPRGRSAVDWLWQG